VIVLIASRNRGKLEELQGLFRGSPMELVLPESRGVQMPHVNEDMGTFKDNALKKAKALAAASGQWALADDSGLEVDILGGAPGIRSARFAGEGASDEANTRKLLKVLRSTRKRRARFKCVLALAKPTGEAITADGSLEGEIAVKAAGEGGFGYDPVFFLPQYGRTLAEIPFREKQQLSHRARAAEKLRLLIPGF